MKKGLFYTISFAAIAVISLSLTNCTTLGIPPVEDEPVASDIVLQISKRESWADHKLDLQRLFESEIYGPWPTAQGAKIISTSVIDDMFLEGLARLEEWSIEIGNVQMTISLVIPNSGDHKAFLIEANSCGNHSSLKDERLKHPSVPVPGFCTVPDFTDPLAVALMGRHYASPPLENILKQGYTYVSFHAGEVAQDNQDLAQKDLDRFEEDDVGAIMAWAWSYARLAALLRNEPRFADLTSVVVGHSRFGKAALVAAAFDDDIDIVISHQSGTLGASLSGDGVGESFVQIIKDYPHWFTSGFAVYAEDETKLPINQHKLIALIAPRPLLLGNARRDIWSDPNGAFVAAQAADEVYEFFGSKGLDQDALRPGNIPADLSFYMRGGRHGVTSENWDVFIQFLAHHTE